MGFYRKLIEIKSKIYDNFLTKPKIVKISIILAHILFFGAIIVGYIIAQFDPQGYDIFKNMISDMGSYRHTPLPYFLDYGAMITSIIILPAVFYMEKRLAPAPDSREFERMRYRLSSLGFFFMLISFFSFFMIGVFSEDRTTILGLHNFFSYIVWSSLIFSSVFYGILILFYKTEIPRLLGAYMTVFPFIAGLLMLIYMTPLAEWTMLFSIVIWIVPIFLILLKNMNSELKNKKETYFLMGLYKSIISWKNKVYNKFLTNPKIVRISILSALISLSFALIIGYIVAQFDPDGYNIVKNFISDMGSFRHTPLPYFLDYGAMISSVLIISGVYYLEKWLASAPTESNSFDRMRYRLSSIGFFFAMMGFFGFFMIGLFSEDRTTSLGLHLFFSYVVFSGLILSSFFYGLLILFYKTEIPRIFGLYMMIFPLISGIWMIYNFCPLSEWLMLFSLLIWMVPVNVILLKNLNNN